MVNRLEKLERFFGGSRRRDKERGARNRDLSVASSASQPQNGPFFPSPSFMHPTSRHMKPREEPISWAKVAAKERSQSLPDPQGKLRRRSSLSSINAVLNHRHYPSDPIRPISFTLKQAVDLVEDLSQFRFPDDSAHQSGSNAIHSNGSINKSAREYDDPELQLENRLDWCPQRISSLFNNLGLETSIDDRLARFTQDKAESSALLPSPILSSPPSPRTRVDSIIIPPRQSSRRSSETPIPDLTNPPRNHPLSPFPTPPDSPPASDGEEDCSKTPVTRARSNKALASPIQLTPRPSFGSNPRNSTDTSIGRYPDRESWGNGPDDPALVSSVLEEDACVPPLRLMRRSTSVTSSSTVTRYVPIDRNLREPTLDDFYTLSDEDVLESLPTTPKEETDIPPTPPPKDSPKTPIGRSRSTRHAPIAPTTTVDVASGELTPPRTPINYQFLTLTYSPTNRSGALGAMWAARIANTYNFDLLYVISLWPKSGRNSSRRPTSKGCPSEAQDISHDGTQCAVVTSPGSRMTGRLLAAYGLTEFGSPFRIHAQFHTQMLGYKGWKEYRDELASPGVISRGWTCSFSGDQNTPTQAEMSGEHGIRSGIIDRGVVFAAYTRKTTKSVIPVNSSPKQTAILGKLLYDAQTLVDALVHGA